jgi:tRNA(fMet)-specific endonuclease VapC
VTLKFLLDTPVVSSPVARTPNRSIVRRLDQQGLYCALAAPVWHELVYGCDRMAPGRRKDALAVYLQDVVHASFEILPYDEAAAAWHGRERARLEQLGTPAPFVDGQIAAIAYTRGLTLVTTNSKDFAAFMGLTVADWTK